MENALRMIHVEMTLNREKLTVQRSSYSLKPIFTLTEGVYLRYQSMWIRGQKWKTLLQPLRFIKSYLSYRLVLHHSPSSLFLRMFSKCCQLPFLSFFHHRYCNPLTTFFKWEPSTRKYKNMEVRSESNYKQSEN